MKTFKRICLKNAYSVNKNGKVMHVECDKEYVTTEDFNGECIVISHIFAKFPSDLFSNKELFTNESESVVITPTVVSVSKDETDATIDKIISRVGHPCSGCKFEKTKDVCRNCLRSDGVSDKWETS